MMLILRAIDVEAKKKRNNCTPNPGPLAAAAFGAALFLGEAIVVDAGVPF